MEEEVVTAAEPTSPKERLVNIVIPALGLSKNQFAKECGVTYAVIAGKSKTIQSSSMKKILNAFPQINKDYLMTGKGEMFVEVPEKRQRRQKLQQAVTALEVIPQQAVEQVETQEVTLLKQKIEALEDEVKFLRHIVELNAKREY
ncbi:MAG: hypothetical protein II951_00865 [Bacteroidales bacterium]|nr:hypothetical protein [Bacteroidales bacterium]